MCCTLLEFNKVLISSSISQPATNDIIAEPELLLLQHKEQQTGAALQLDWEFQSQRMCTQHTAEEHYRACRQTAHICYWLAGKQQAETIVTHCGDAVWRLWEKQKKFHISHSFSHSFLTEVHTKSFKHLVEVSFKNHKETWSSPCRLDMCTIEYSRKKRLWVISGHNWLFTKPHLWTAIVK